ncbi:unnamed protein product [Adineta ricciae]|uniref:Uncharacterized protein n=1 Tax=Adineta ricciae TaxID=249248 RepID=A0A813YP02_ADIRI|nr:unnamed protein product [Adineta ricciae]
MQRTSTIQSTSTVQPVIQVEDTGNESAVWIVFHYVFQGIFHVSNGSSYTYSAIVAVIVVHIVLIAFLFAAFREEIPRKKKSTAKDSTDKQD